MAKKENQLKLRNQKGWKGFVQSYNNYVENGSYDDVKWGNGTKKPKSVETDKMGRKIYKF